MRLHALLIVILWSALILSVPAEAATISGIVYDVSLNPAKDVIITVNSTPKQTIVSKNGSYSFFLSEGTYEIRAQSRYGMEKAMTNETIVIKAEGKYNIDLILFPDFSEEERMLNEEPDVFGLTNIIEEESDRGSGIFLIILPFIIIVLFFIIIFRKGKNKRKETKGNDLDMIINFIRSEGGRTTQKEIRKNFQFSEAKISLMLTDLEDRGIIRKIKRGKSNVIILN